MCSWLTRKLAKNTFQGDRTTHADIDSKKKNKQERNKKQKRILKKGQKKKKKSLNFDHRPALQWECSEKTHTLFQETCTQRRFQTLSGKKKCVFSRRGERGGPCQKNQVCEWCAYTGQVAGYGMGPLMYHKPLFNSVFWGGGILYLICHFT